MSSCVLRGTARAGQVPEQNRPKSPAHTELEVTGLYGQSAGYLGCGEQGRMRYAGSGVRLAHSMRSPQSPLGAGALVAGSVVHELDQLVIDEVNNESFLSDEHETKAGHHHGFGVTSAELRGGYHFAYVGVELGIMAWFPHKAPDGTTGMVLPAGEFSFGSRRLVFAMLGMGAPHLSMVRSFGTYLGLGVELPRRSQIRLYYSDYMTPVTTTSHNLEALWYVPLRPSFDLRASFAASFLAPLPDYQTSVGMRTIF